MCKISVIMPVYNSEKYLPHAVKSVLDQDFDSFELILVDDGSTDMSDALCDDFARKDSRVKVIHKQNGGICSARNAGLAVAKGEYVTFCDNDDEYLPGLLSENYAIAKENNADLMRFAIKRRIVKENGAALESIYDLKSEVLNKNEFAEHYKNVRKEDGVWSAFFRRAVLEKYKIRFDERFKHGLEDGNFSLRFLLHTERAAFNSKHYYVWSQRYVHSTSRKFYRETLNDNIRNMNIENCFLQEVCENRVDPAVKYTFYVNEYLYPIIEYMTLKSCDLSEDEKLHELRRLRRHPLFSGEISDKTFARIKKENKRVYITLKLFYTRRYKPLLLVLNCGMAILNTFRYKK